MSVKVWVAGNIAGGGTVTYDEADTFEVDNGFLFIKQGIDNIAVFRHEAWFLARIVED